MPWAIWSMKVPVQSEFTMYVPELVAAAMLPLVLDIPPAAVFPFPSKVCAPTSAYGPSGAGAATKDPVTVYAKVPCRVALLHPLLIWAFAMGAIPRARAVTAAIVKIFSMVLRFMIISFEFINCSCCASGGLHLALTFWLAHRVSGLAEKSSPPT